MTSTTLFRSASISLVAGGLLCIAAHLMHPACPTGPDDLSAYAHRSQPTHLLLFFGVLFVIMGLPGILIRQRSRAGLLGFISIHLLIFGLLFGEALHSILEFSILPLLVRSFPYATISLANSIYHSTPLGLLQNAGYTLYLLGCPLLAITTLRSKILPEWAAFPLCMTTAINFAVFLAPFRDLAYKAFPLAFYVSICVLGSALWISTRPSFAFYNMPSSSFDGAG
jgi:hypothetical protein